MRILVFLCEYFAWGGLDKHFRKIIITSSGDEGKKKKKKIVKTTIHNAISLKKGFVARESSQGCDFLFAAMCIRPTGWTGKNILFRKKEKISGMSKSISEWILFKARPNKKRGQGLGYVAFTGLFISLLGQVPKLNRFTQWMHLFVKRYCPKGFCSPFIHSFKPRFYFYFFFIFTEKHFFPCFFFWGKIVFSRASEFETSGWLLCLGKFIIFVLLGGVCSSISDQIACTYELLEVDDAWVVERRLSLWVRSKLGNRVNSNFSQEDFLSFSLKKKKIKIYYHFSQSINRLSIKHNPFPSMN